MDITDRVVDALSEVSHLGISLGEQRRKVAEHLVSAIFPLIETPEQLRELVPDEDNLTGTIIKSVGAGTHGFALGSVFEQNTDGTWVDYDSPEIGPIQPEDMPLPAFVIWRS